MINLLSTDGQPRLKLRPDRFVRKPFAFVMTITLSCALSCANPFSTREPEPPDRGGSSYVNPSDPTLVFQNMRIAIGQRNVENYLRSFVDTSRSVRGFEFIPDQGVAAANPGIFLGWSLEDERRYLVELLQAIPKDSTASLSFDIESFSESANTATFVQDYFIVAKHSQRSQGIGGEIRGRATFFLEQDESGNWAIYRWEDLKLEAGQESWSELKAFFR